MRKAFIRSLIGISHAALCFTTPPGRLTGRWQKRFPNGVVVGAVFQAASSYDGFANGKTFVSGKYTHKGDTLAISDPVCGIGYYGTYQLTFIAPDSIRQTLIEDTCRIRRETIGASPTNGRIKRTKP